MRRRALLCAFALAAAGQARAQDRAAGDDGQADGPSPPPQAQAGAAEPTSGAFDRACLDLLEGRTPTGEKAIETLRDACAKLMSGRAQERIDADRRRQADLASRAQPNVAPGQSTAQPQQGQGALAAFGQAASELGQGGGRAKPLGMRSRGPVGYTLVTNPLGWFSGLGVNAELFGVFEDVPKLSWVAGVRYSQTDATNGTAKTFGALGGVDFFIIGRNNEGLRIGPRLDLAAGSEQFNGNTTFARLGLGGELGYNFIASNGITAMAALGVGGRVAGDSKNNSFSSFVGGELGPYGTVGLGYSW